MSNVVNTPRRFDRWMGMFTIPNQLSDPMAYKEFDEAGRMRQSGYYGTVVDVMEELFKNDVAAAWLHRLADEPLQ